MLVVVAALLASYIPSVLFFLWLRSLHKDDEEYKKICGRVLRSGMLSVFPVALASFILNILMVLVLKDTVPVLVREAIYNFLVIANAEEMVKYWTGNKYVKEFSHRASWTDITAFMGIAACGFSIVESAVYAFGTSIGQILVRGLTALHGFYGLIMGYMIGKSMHTGNRSYKVMALLIPIFLHGLYDFSLTGELMEVSDNFVFLPFIAIHVTWIIGFWILYRLRKGKNDPLYTDPIFPRTEPQDKAAG